MSCLWGEEDRDVELRRRNREQAERIGYLERTLSGVMSNLGCVLGTGGPFAPVAEGMGAREFWEDGFDQGRDAVDREIAETLDAIETRLDRILEERA